MFGPIRGEWPDDKWQGWWGDDPPYHVPVFVLSHYPRASITMAGGTAGGQDVRLGGGVSTIRQYLRAGLE